MQILFKYTTRVIQGHTWLDDDDGCVVVVVIVVVVVAIAVDIGISRASMITENWL